jgi:hypothetical protein
MTCLPGRRALSQMHAWSHCCFHAVALQTTVFPCRASPHLGRKVGGQGAVVFAQHVNSPIKLYAIKFFLDKDAFAVEHAAANNPVSFQPACAACVACVCCILPACAACTHLPACICLHASALQACSHPYGSCKDIISTVHLRGLEVAAACDSVHACQGAAVCSYLHCADA